MNRPLVFLDTELTALESAPHLVEVGAIRVVDGEALHSFSELVRPEVPVDPRATEVHGLSTEELGQADSAGLVLARFLDWLDEDDWLVAHNMPADANALGFELARAELEPPDNALFDSLKLVRKGLPDAPDHRLETLIEHLELDVETTHRALADAVACWQVTEAALEEIADGEPVTETLVLQFAGLSGTLAQWLPAPPSRRRQAVRRLDGARREERVVTLIYGGDGQQPVPIPVLPRLLYGRDKRGYLEGECQKTGALKTYRLDRVQRIVESS